MSTELAGIDLANLVLILGTIAGLGLLAAAAVGSLGGERKRVARRIDRIETRLAAAPDHAPRMTVRLSQADSSIKGFDTLIKRYLPNPTRLRERLAKTGKRISLGEFLLANLLVAAVGFLLLNALFGLSLVPAVLFGIALGLWLPNALIGVLINRRLKRFTGLFPDAIDLIVRGLKTGLPVTESIRSVGQELPDPIGVEFRRIIDSFAIGQTLEQALWSAAARLDTPEFRFFVISLSVQQETGGNLGETLENLATILRRRKQMRLKIRALSAEVRASAVIIGALPFVMFAMLYLVNPSYVSVLIDDPRGRVMLGGALFSLATGLVIMFKMARFEI